MWNDIGRSIILSVQKSLLPDLFACRHLQESVVANTNY